MTLGERVKLKREELGLSQEELAEKMKYKSKTSIHKIEQGITDLPLSKVSELAKVLGVTSSYLMGWTEEKQQPLKEKSNAIFLGDDSTFIYIPLYESISAGYGSEESEFIEMIPLYGLRKNGNDYFAVKVRGYSMEPKISDSSIIIIKKDVTIENGEIGAFYLNGETFVKQKRIGNGKIILHSFNNAFSDIVINEYDDFKEYGKVVGDYNLY